MANQDEMRFHGQFCEALLRFYDLGVERRAATGPRDYAGGLLRPYLYGLINGQDARCFLWPWPDRI